MKNISFLIALLPFVAFAQNTTQYLIDSKIDTSQKATISLYTSIWPLSLHFVNGKEVDGWSFFWLISSHHIISQNVLHSAAAGKKYGNDGHFGAVEISLDAPNMVPLFSLYPKYGLTKKAEKLPVFVGDIRVAFPKIFYFSPNQIDNISLGKNMDGDVVFVSRKPYPLKKIFYLVNGKYIDETFLDYINPSAVKDITEIEEDSAIAKLFPSETDHYMYGFNMMVNKDSILTRNDIYKQFSVNKKHWNYPLFVNFNSISHPENFVVSKGLGLSLYLDKHRKFISITMNRHKESHFNVPKTLNKHLRSMDEDFEYNHRVLTCSISRQSLLQQYAKK